MKKPPYVTHPGVAMEEKALAGLKDKTGRDLDEWTRLIQTSGPEGVKPREAWLKEKHALTTMYARWLAERATLPVKPYDAEACVEQLFSGKKAALRPLYDQLLELACSLGPDVTATPCATMVPLRRKFVFAQLKPTTNTRLDVGLALGSLPAEGRLVDTGGYAKKDRITHRIAVTSTKDIDRELFDWLQRAYLGE